MHPHCVCHEYIFSAAAAGASFGNILSIPCDTCRHPLSDHNLSSHSTIHVSTLAPTLGPLTSALQHENTHVPDSSIHATGHQVLGPKEKRKITPPEQVLRSKKIAPATPVTITTLKAKRSPPMPLNDQLCRRDVTVDNLIKRVLEQGAVLVRGTPASGKSTLLRCFYWRLQELRDENPQIPEVYRVNLWEEAIVPKTGGWKAYVRERTDGDLELRSQMTEPYIVCIDEAQTSYWDNDFWADYIKGIVLDDRSTLRIHHVVLFASYGSNIGSEMYLHHATTPYLNGLQLVGLRPEPSEKHPVGLLFTRAECDDAIARHVRATGKRLIDYNNPHICNLLFEITQGHTGAVISLLQSLERFEPFEWRIRQEIPLTPQELNFEFFCNIKDSAFKVVYLGQFCRGLPTADALRNPMIANIFERTLFEMNLTKSEAITWSPAEQESLLICHRKGWLHLYQPDPSDHNSSAYVFASQLHEWFVGAFLGKINNSPKSIQFLTPLEMSIEAIKQYRSNQILHASLDGTRIGPGTALQQPWEAVYQNEFYRSMYKILKQRLLILPEWGKGGRIDFFISDHGWGIELVRDSATLEKHIDRFNEGGQYWDWIQQGIMRDYVILDFQCRDSPPRLCNPKWIKGAEKVFHVVFTEDRKYVKIVNSQGTEVLPNTRLLES